MKEPKLCYVEGCWAYFTTQSLDKQWGDDWNDAPYEHNAGSPYTSRDNKWEIIKVAYEGDFYEPYEGHYNSPYNVETINRGNIAWLSPTPWSAHAIHIYAGTTLDRFIELVKESGGEVYTRIGQDKIK